MFTVLLLLNKSSQLNTIVKINLLPKWFKIIGWFNSNIQMLIYGHTVFILMISYCVLDDAEPNPKITKADNFNSRERKGYLCLIFYYKMFCL